MNGAMKNTESRILDCGTFSLHFAKSIDEEKVSIEGYIRYLKRFGKYYDFYFSFDRNFTVNGFEENKKSLERLKKERLKPVPVIHDYYRGEIDYYIGEGYELVALGSIMEEGSSKMLRKQKDINYAVEKLYQNDVKMHLFGASSYKTISHLPLFSCDSSSWAQNNKYGYILYWNPLKEGEDKTDKLFFYDNEINYDPTRQYFNEYPFRNKLEMYLGELGITFHNLTSTDKHYYRQLVNVIYYLTIEDIVKEKHKRLGYSQ